MPEIYVSKKPATQAVYEDLKPKGNYDQKYSLQNMSFSGVDAVATIIIPTIGKDGLISSHGEVVTLGELQTISYSIHRENSPIRTLGHTNVRGFVKGGRTIAGSLIFTVFNEYVFYRIAQYRDLLARKNGFFAPLADMLPPFDIVVSFFNEYGQGSKMKIFGVTIVDEGQTVSVDDLIIEQTYTYMARGIQPMVELAPESAADSTRSKSEAARDLAISRNIFGDATIDDLYELDEARIPLKEEEYQNSGRSSSDANMLAEGPKI
jgi:hypothetical protein